MAIYSTTNPVFRHAQDDDRSCGRACAQMIISSLMPPAPGRIVQQAPLQMAEPNPFDLKNWWRTEPLELADLLNGELPVPHREWRVAHFASPFDMLAEVVLSIKQHGRPAAVLINRFPDHWCVIFEVQFDPLSDEWVFAMYDPAPPVPLVELLTGITFPGHDFQDSCSGIGAPVQWFHSRAVVDDDGLGIHKLGGLDFQVDNLPLPASVQESDVQGPRPAGPLPTLAQVPEVGQCAAVVFGPASKGHDRYSIASSIEERTDWQTGVPLSPQPVTEVDTGGLTQLESLARRFDIPELREFLNKSMGSRVTRLVQDLYKPERQFVLQGMQSTGAHSVVMAVFGAAQGAPLLHFQLSNDQRLLQRLATSDANSSLWWARRRLMPGAPLDAQIYPYTRLPLPAAGTVKLTRLYDAVETDVLL